MSDADMAVMMASNTGDEAAALEVIEFMAEYCRGQHTQHKAAKKERRGIFSARRSLAYG